MSTKRTADEAPTEEATSKRLSPLLLGGLLAFMSLSWLSTERQTRFEDLALGVATTSVLAEAQGHKVHGTTFAQMNEVLAGTRAGSLSRQVLWLGNSQLHAINQYREGQATGPGLLFEQLRARDINLMTFSFPNANLQEHYVAYSYARAQVANLRVLLLPVVFDDLREGSIRPDLKAALKNEGVRARLSRTKIGQRLLAELGNDASEVQDEDLGGVKDTTQELSERALNGWLEDNWEMWRARPQARGKLIAQLYTLRNSALGITAQSKRPMRKGSYQANMAALESLLADARSDEVAVLLYIVPLRDDIAPPYVANEYDSFRKTLRGLAGEGVHFADLGGLVPPKLWGLKDATDLDGKLEVDFMHFQGEGHRLLADAMSAELSGELAEALR